jgi:hypothetical protein
MTSESLRTSRGNTFGRCPGLSRVRQVDLPRKVCQVLSASEMEFVWRRFERATRCPAGTTLVPDSVRTELRPSGACPRCAGAPRVPVSRQGMTELWTPQSSPTVPGNPARMRERLGGGADRTRGHGLAAADRLHHARFVTRGAPSYAGHLSAADRLECVDPRVAGRHCQGCCSLAGVTAH